MTYATNTQVQGLVGRSFASGFSASTVPTDTQVDTFRSMIYGEVNMHLSAVGYVTPISTPTDFTAWLSLVEGEGVAAMVLKAFAPESVVSDSGGPVIPAYAFWESRYKAALKAIDDRTVDSESAAMTGGLARAYLTDYPDNDPWQDGATDGQQPIASMSSNLREF